MTITYRTMCELNVALFEIAINRQDCSIISCSSNKLLGYILCLCNYFHHNSVSLAYSSRINRYLVKFSGFYGRDISTL